MMDGNRVFLVGVGRSGTSLLQSMLHAHPDVAFLPETHFCRRYLVPRVKSLFYEQLGIDVFSSILSFDNKYQRSGIAEGDLLAPFREGTCTFSTSAVYKRLIRMYRKKKDVTVIGVKDPRLIDYLSELKLLFPKARIVHIVRDPRDVLLSRMNADWSAGRPDWLHMLTYRAQISRGVTEGRSSFGPEYLEVRYEDLLADPEKVLSKVAAHVGVNYSETMLSFQRSAEELVHDSERTWKAETMGPLLRSNTGKWRNGLSEWQICLTERLCNNAFDWFDYDRAEPSARMNRSRSIALRLAPVFGALFDYMYAVVSRFR